MQTCIAPTTDENCCPKTVAAAVIGGMRGVSRRVSSRVAHCGPALSGLLARLDSGRVASAVVDGCRDANAARDQRL